MEKHRCQSFDCCAPKTQEGLILSMRANLKKLDDLLNNAQFASMCLKKDIADLERLAAPSEGGS